MSIAPTTTVNATTDPARTPADTGPVELLPVILSGGSGTRLWPLSRETHPKQLLALTGTRSMLQDTAVRLDGFRAAPVSTAPIVVCNADYRFITAEHLRACGLAQARIVLEPVGRNTAPALTLAAQLARPAGARADPVLLVMPADHVITDRAAFHAAIAAGLPAAADGAVVTFGIVPTRAETGYGYLRVGAERGDGTRELAAFVEKPDSPTAQTYLAGGDHLWNSGLFMLRASVWLRAIAHFAPGIAQACSQAVKGARDDLDFVRVDEAAFRACPSDSIDYAVMEKLPQAPALHIPVRVVPMAAGWSDVGAWDALWDVLPHDLQGNATRGDVALHDSQDTLVVADARFVAGVGLRGIVVVETPDAVLVADKSRTQEVRNIVAQLKAQGRPQGQVHRKMYRPWGWYDSIDAGERFQVKRIVVNPGARLSLQMHHHRAEHWIVVRGTAEVTRGEQTFLLSENESTYIPLGQVHRLANPGKVPLELIEVQSGSYLGEDDIVRLEDTYGR